MKYSRKSFRKRTTMNSEWKIKIINKNKNERRNWSKSHIIFNFFRKLEKQKEKLCNTAKGRDLPECWKSSTTLPPSIVPLTSTTSDYIADVTTISSQLGNNDLYFLNNLNKFIMVSSILILIYNPFIAFFRCSISM